MASSPYYMGALVAWEDVFSSQELDSIERYGDRLTHEDGTLLRNVDHEVRNSRISWIAQTSETLQLYNRIAQIAFYLNTHFFKYELFGLKENFQYTVYRSTDKSHYDWHVDYGPHKSPARKISLSIQLTDPQTYEGCDLEVRGGIQINVAPRRRGTIIAFPSFVLHRVTPIKSGTRKSLVVWVAGPEFR